MSKNLFEGQPSYRVYPVGYVQGSEEEGFRVEVLEPFRAGLKQLKHFSHVMVFWWADQHDNDVDRSVLQAEPSYAESKMTGVFACRSEYRPNPIALTTCKIIDVDEAGGAVYVLWIDAYPGTPVIDLKAYFPVSDRPKNVQIPEWLSGWPEWMPDDTWMPENWPPDDLFE